LRALKHTAPARATVAAPQESQDMNIESICTRHIVSL